VERVLGHILAIKGGWEFRRKNGEKNPLRIGEERANTRGPSGLDPWRLNALVRYTAKNKTRKGIGSERNGGFGSYVENCF